MAYNSDRTREDVLKRANAYLHEAPSLESNEAIKRYLASAGVDVPKAQEKAKALVTRMLANRRLDLARQRRITKIDILTRIKTRASNFGESGRRLLSLAESGDLNGAALLARKFEESCPEDVASLEEDLALLDEIEKDNEPDAGR
jgi:hypothetical protein